MVGIASMAIILLALSAWLVINQFRLTGKVPSAISDIIYMQTQKDASIDAITDSSQRLDNGNPILEFHHNSDKQELLTLENIAYNREQLFYGREHV